MNLRFFFPKSAIGQPTPSTVMHKRLHSMRSLYKLLRSYQDRGAFRTVTKT